MSIVLPAREVEPPRVVHRRLRPVQHQSTWLADGGIAVPRAAGLATDMAADMVRAIIAHAGTDADVDPLLTEIVRRSIEAFLTHAGHPVTAAQSVSDVLHRIGSREAAMGRSFENLVNSFQVARDAFEVHLPRLLVRHPLPAGSVERLREDLDAFLGRLLQHAREGFDRRWAVGEMPPELARTALRRALFDPASPAGLDDVQAYVACAGLDPEARWTPVVRLDAPLPADSAASTPSPRSTLAGLHRGEALVADRSVLAELVATRSVLVVGPPAVLAEARRALHLARRTAELVAAGLVPGRLPEEPGVVVRTQDVLGELVSFADPYLAQLLVERHLEPLAALDVRRRLDLAEPLLAWLESGCAVSKLARDLGYHEQTIHHRFRRIRALYPPDVLDDPRQRFELIVALRTALPRWRHDGDTR